MVYPLLYNLRMAELTVQRVLPTLGQQYNRDKNNESHRYNNDKTD